MIKIEKLYIINENKKSRLVCDFLIKENEKETIWYEFDCEYSKYICYEVIDGIVVNILLYCMERGYDIYSDIPISEKLYYGLEQYLIPSISKYLPQYKSIKIKAPISNMKLPCEKKVGTGLSGGVDSFYSILNNMNNPTTSFNITHLCFFNAGACGNCGGDETRELYNKRLEYVKPIARELGLPLISVDTNMNEFLHQKHLYTHTFRSLAIPLILQKLFGVYYYSAGYSFNDMSFSMDPAHYDLLTLQCISTENITFYSSGGENSRIEKVDCIADNRVAKKYLNVCVKEYKNCSSCDKCKRTIMELYVMDKLEGFSNIFDFDKFKKWKNKYIGYMLYKKDIFSCEILDAMEKRKKRIPLSSKFFWKYYSFVMEQLGKFYHRIKRS